MKLFLYEKETKQTKLDIEKCVLSVFLWALLLAVPYNQGHQL